jgi:hypothetical protein
MATEELLETLYCLGYWGVTSGGTSYETQYEYSVQQEIDMGKAGQAGLGENAMCCSSAPCKNKGLWANRTMSTGCNNQV